MKLYVGRDEQDTLYLYTTKPTKSLAFWCTISTDILKLDSNLLPEVKWEDEEPTEGELVTIEMADGRIFSGKCTSTHTNYVTATIEITITPEL